MQVISGKYRGYRLRTLPGMNTRPMTARVKEDMFNILNNYFIFDNKIGLDIFAGSGQLGIEGLSRGLQYCYFNDVHLGAINVIKTNLTNLKIENAHLFQQDYKLLLNSFLTQKLTIDILFLDPPFIQINYYYDIISIILKNNILNPNGIIVCEANQPLDFEQFDLNLLKLKQYQNKYLYLLRLERD
ncbi:16S rRNA (guanine(966)-N(2))-methyltransferase RsmD [Spiroplasma chrysopicola]|uniref:N6-adenine-specific methylase n=1 Tax=Spiroplasma chrysopicola DF-1 TaxID=1276227 RepID=R4U0S8_9MOLU|nr:16S rRNA (guanine(966)-N(2))-methyltransferase RsmD [Spiroplasma chrysopicola]AGM24887.1 N6-adenine-specific methylase [Spiroplasma chrysopicola DF-1]